MASTQSGATVTGLPAGTYNVRIVDANLCVANGDIAIIQGPSPLIVDISPSPAKCNGGNDGSAVANPSGGVPRYTYTWNGSTDTDASLNNVPAGSYTVNVTDSYGCTVSKSGVITQPSALHTVEISNIDVSCKGGNDGSASIITKGGTGPYSYLWPPSAGSSTLSSVDNLTARVYVVTISDSHGCITNHQVTIDEPNMALSNTVATVNALCSGIGTGTATSNPAGGTPPYSYQWTTGLIANAAGNSVSMLPAGTYTVTVTDYNGCQVENDFDILNQVLLALNPSSTPVTCFGYTDGVAQVAVTGTALSLSYVWSAGANGQTTDVITGLVKGDYSVTVTDVNNCQSSTSINVDGSDSPLYVDAESIRVSCNGKSDGQAIVTGMDGGSPYTYTWNGTTVTSNALTNIPIGDYTANVTDIYGCTVSETITVVEPFSLEVIDGLITDVSCKGGKDGTASVITYGGTPPYRFLWPVSAGSQTLEKATNLKEGTYIVTVTDENSCIETHSVTILEPALSLTSSVNSIDVFCHGYNNGIANVLAVGGTPPYKYEWTKGLVITPSRDSVIDVPSGSYNVTVTDSHGCTSISLFTIKDASLITATFSTIESTCFGDADGRAEITVSGGFAPFMYQWGNGLVPSNINTGLAAGSYSVTVEDSKGCFNVFSYTIDQPIKLKINLVNISPILCFGESTGTASIVPSGGTFPYDYLWDINTGSQTSQQATFLPSGSYRATITDGKGCEIDTLAVVTEPAESLKLSAIGTPITCFESLDGSISSTVVGGTPPYSVYWDIKGVTVQGPEVPNLDSGIYSGWVIDINGCQDYFTVHVPGSDNPLLVSATVTDAMCFGYNDGQIDLAVSGGVLPYDIIWDDGSGFKREFRP